MTINIIIADEHTIIRRGVLSMIKALPTTNTHSVIGDTDSPTELLNLLAHHQVDILFLGFSLNTFKSNTPVSGLDGTALIKWLNNRYPQLRIVVISPYKNPEIIKMTLEVGARGYISRSACEKTLSRTISSVLNNEVYIERGLMDSLFRREQSGPHELSPREIDVLRLICKGMSLTQISEQLNLSNKTISAHKLRAMDKLGVRSDCQLYCLLSKTQMFDINI